MVKSLNIFVLLITPSFFFQELLTHIKQYHQTFFSKSDRLSIRRRPLLTQRRRSFLAVGVELHCSFKAPPNYYTISSFSLFNLLFLVQFFSFIFFVSSFSWVGCLGLTVRFFLSSLTQPNLRFSR